MRTARLDIGSRSIELVVVDSQTGDSLFTSEAETTPDMAAVCRTMIDQVTFDRLIVTGYGRSLAEMAFGFPSVTEIKAYARGARVLFPDCCPEMRTFNSTTAPHAWRAGCRTSCCGFLIPDK